MGWHPFSGDPESKKATPIPRHMKGFTLVEVLVVLVLSSVIATLLIQGMSFLWGIQSRYDDLLGDQAIEDMRANWWRQSIRGLITDKPNGEMRFKGSGRELVGWSLLGLDAEQGAPVEIRWVLEKQGGESRLFYKDQFVLKWPNDVAFAYFDNRGVAYENWPPEFESLPQLPAVVVMEVEGRVLLAASPSQPQVPVFEAPFIGGL